MPLDIIAHDHRPPAPQVDNHTSLAEAARAKMERVFAGGEHRPSDNQWAAIMDYLQHAEEAAKGQLRPAVYLSAIPAGTGKSVAVAAVAAALVETAAYDGVGVLIAVNGKLKKREEWVAWLLGQGWHQAKLQGGLMGLRRTM